jgi:hypothetical protein
MKKMMIKRSNNKLSPQQKYDTFGSYYEVLPTYKGKITLLKRILGYSCLVIAVFPNGLGFIFYPLAFTLLGISIKDIKKGYKQVKRSIKHLIKYYKKRLQNRI